MSNHNQNNQSSSTFDLSDSFDFCSITDDEFNFLSKFIHQRLGIYLSPAKRTLLNTRLQSVLKQMKFTSFSEYIDYVTKDPSGEALSELASKISTNFSYFYREEKHFEFFKSIAIPSFTSEPSTKQSKKLRIWSAGCATGEEPYMLVMLLNEAIGLEYPSWDAGVLATDISEKALKSAVNGIYSQDRLDKLPGNYKHKYLKKLEGDQFQVSDRIRNDVTFRRYNLLNTSPPFKSKFHIIFCRNVMIYFDQPTKKQLINTFINLLVPNGYLFIGHSESIHQDFKQLKSIKPAIYQKIV